MRIAEQDFFAPKAFGHRTRSAEETLQACLPLMETVGITRLANITGLDRLGLPVWTAIRPNARALATAQGKGTTDAAAKVSALMEAIETWHGERIELPVVIKAFAGFAPGEAITPGRLPIRADTQAFPDRPIAWIAAWDLAADRKVYVPFDSVSTNFVEHPECRPLFLRTTNGLASGNHLLEALVYGLLEVIERDALTLHSLRSEAGRTACRIDPASITDPHLVNLLGIFCQAGVDVLIEDVTSDIAVPVFSCTLAECSAQAQYRPVPRASGYGAHLDPLVALTRAIHEAVQSRATLISGSRDDMFPRDYDAANAEPAHDLHESVETPMRAFATSASAAGDSFEADLATLLQRLRAAGLGQVAFVDLTRDDIAIPVVKLVVPDLEPVRSGVWSPGPRARAILQGARA